MLTDLRRAVRHLGHHGGFAAAVILTLALGIGANTAIFSVVYGVLLRPAPIQGMDRLVVVWETDRNSGTDREPASVPDFLDFQAASRTLDALEALYAGERTLTPPSGEPVRLASLRVTGGLLPLAGMQPVAGRVFSDDEAAVGGPAVALISESLWRRAFNRDPSLLGGSLLLDDVPHTVVGVLPDASDFGVLQVLSAAAYSRGYAARGEGAQVDVWLPLAPDVAALPRQTHPIIMIGRLAPGVTVEQAGGELAALAANLEAQYPEANDGRGVHVEMMSDVVFGPVRPALYLLLAAVALLLLVACVNVANLQLARGAARAQEVAVRRALGADAGRLLRQFLVESLVLTMTAAVAGVGVAYVGLDLLLALAPAGIPRLTLVSIDLPVLSLALGTAVGVGILFGLLPLFQARHTAVQHSLNDQGGFRGSAGPGFARLRSVLVVAQLALAVMLLAGAGLLVRSFWALQQVDPGFRAQGVVKAEFTLPSSRYPLRMEQYPDFPEQRAFTSAIVEDARRLPGVTAAAVAGSHPLDPGSTNSFTVIGHEAEAEGWPELSIRRVTSGYFETAGLALIEGRLLDDRDTTDSEPVVIVNERVAQRFFPAGDAMGARFRWWGTTRTVVGIVADERIYGIAAAPPVAVYVPLAQAPSTNGAGVLLVRGADPDSLAAAAGRVIRARDPALAVLASSRSNEPCRARSPRVASRWSCCWCLPLSRCCLAESVSIASSVTTSPGGAAKWAFASRWARSRPAFCGWCSGAVSY